MAVKFTFCSLYRTLRTTLKMNVEACPDMVVDLPVWNGTIIYKKRHFCPNFWSKLHISEKSYLRNQKLNMYRERAAPIISRVPLVVHKPLDVLKNAQSPSVRQTPNFITNECFQCLAKEFEKVPIFKLVYL